ncbi:hypothetical protein HMPREF1316_1412 [Olsenella profusa F0195]|uniref:Uncharacterized protein n=1 Tax=Olsenella profusa F0195 TaxID=1125712 RepID=U2V3N5_9ACTN|nr:hypothetical protein HMPREF1316_1412 [Olsenella profusa F0195]
MQSVRFRRLMLRVPRWEFPYVTQACTSKALVEHGPRGA